MFLQNWKIRLLFTKVGTMVGDKNFFFWYNPKNAGKHHPGKEMLLSLFIMNFGWDME